MPLKLTIENKLVNCQRDAKVLKITIDDKLTINRLTVILITFTYCNRQLKGTYEDKEILSREQGKRLSEAYTMSTFKYCLLISMFDRNNDFFNNIHKHTLQLIYQKKN